MFKQSVVLLSGLLSASAFAQWTLDQDNSALHFMSTKNAQVTEVHSFDHFSGKLSDSGTLTIEVPLDSVNTNIPIRNTRMQEMLFEVAKYPTATFSTNLPSALLDMAAGTSKASVVEGELSLHGMTAPVSFNVMVSKLSDDTIQASTISPTLIGSDTFGLKGGVEALQNIAGLKSITFNAPVTFSVTFEK